MREEVPVQPTLAKGTKNFIVRVDYQCLSRRPLSLYSFSDLVFAH
jgi:hypothetical protein